MGVQSHVCIVRASFGVRIMPVYSHTGPAHDVRAAHRVTQHDRISPWIELVARFGRFRPRRGPRNLPCDQSSRLRCDLGDDTDGRSAVVRQYRTAVERHTWEFPAGMVDGAEHAAAACVRELKEETGLMARRVHALGTYAPDTARLSNAFHAFFVETEEPAGNSRPEQGMMVELVDFPNLCSSSCVVSSCCKAISA